MPTSVDIQCGHDCCNSNTESFRTATWLKNIVLKALGYLLAFLRKGTWLKSVVLEERLTVPDYLLHHPV
jgi:hypothetical protein